MRNLNQIIAQITFLFVMLTISLAAVCIGEPVVFDNGHPLYDSYGNLLHAHGGGILQHGGYFYYFGENRNYNSNDTFFAVSCYRSSDLKNWEFRNNILTRDSDPDLGFAKLERPKVVYCANTGKFVMWGHKEYGDNYDEYDEIWESEKSHIHIEFDPKDKKE